MAQGGPVAIEYAAPAPGAAHPAGLLRQLRRRAGRRHAGGARALRGVRGADQGRLGAPTSEFRRVFTRMMIPGGTEEQMRWLDDLQRMAVDAETAVAGPVAAPGDRLARPAARARPADAGAAQPRGPDERVRARPATWRRASGAPGWCALESNNHIVLGRRAGLAGVHARDDGLPRPGPARRADRRVADVASVLSPRELDILRLAAEGRDNDAIAAELVLSVRTVERHLQNAYAKLGLQGQHGPHRGRRAAPVPRLTLRASRQAAADESRSCASAPMWSGAPNSYRWVNNQPSRESHDHHHHHPADHGDAEDRRSRPSTPPCGPAATTRPSRRDRRPARRHPGRDRRRQPGPAGPRRRRRHRQRRRSRPPAAAPRSIATDLTPELLEIGRRPRPPPRASS